MKWLISNRQFEVFFSFSFKKNLPGKEGTAAGCISTFFCGTVKNVNKIKAFLYKHTIQTKVKLIYSSSRFRKIEINPNIAKVLIIYTSITSTIFLSSPKSNELDICNRTNCTNRIECESKFDVFFPIDSESQGSDSERESE